MLQLVGSGTARLTSVVLLLRSRKSTNKQLAPDHEFSIYQAQRLVHFSHCCNQIPDKGRLRGERVYFHSHSIMAGEARPWEHKVTGHMASPVRPQRETGLLLSLLSPFNVVQDSAQEMMATFTSTNLTWAIPASQMCPQAGLSTGSRPCQVDNDHDTTSV